MMLKLMVEGVVVVFVFLIGCKIGNAWEKKAIAKMMVKWSETEAGAVTFIQSLKDRISKYL